jgi:protein TonB
MKRINALRPLIFKISLVISLFAVMVLMNFTMPVVFADLSDENVYEEDRTEIIRTPRRKPREDLPPPKDRTEKIVFVDKTIESDSIAIEPEPMPIDIVIGDDTTNVIAVRVMLKPPPPAEEEVEDNPIVFADKMPVFGDCNLDTEVGRRSCTEKAMLEYMALNIKYPELAKEIGLTGRVVLRFVVGKDGHVRDCTIVRDIGAGCADEAIRVVKGMPKWKPGVQRGRQVSVIYTLPVNFSLR